MNHIKSIITGTSAEGIIEVRRVDGDPIVATPGQRIQLLALDGFPFIKPAYAHILSYGASLSLHFPENEEIYPGQELLLNNPAGQGIKHLQGNNKFLIRPNGSNISFLSTFIHFFAQDPSNQISCLIDKDRRIFMPNSVELINEDEYAQSVEWADKILLETTADRLSDLIQTEISQLSKQDRRKVNVFVNAEYGCGGKGDCGLCVSQTADGRKLSMCEKGPLLTCLDLFNE